MGTIATNNTVDFLVTMVTLVTKVTAVIVATFAAMTSEVTNVCYILKKYIYSSVLGLVDQQGQGPQMTKLMHLIR